MEGGQIKTSVHPQMCLSPFYPPPKTDTNHPTTSETIWIQGEARTCLCPPRDYPPPSWVGWGRQGTASGGAPAYLSLTAQNQ